MTFDARHMRRALVLLKPQVTIKTPFEGDTVMSPSARLVITRVAGPDDEQLGFVLRKVVATPSGTSYAVTAPEIARYCFSGQYALFPHFRSDGWIYATIRDANTKHEYMVASDAALLAE